MAEGYSDGVVKEKLDVEERAIKSHHRRIGGLEVQMSDVHVRLAGGKEARENMEEDIKEIRRTANEAKKEAKKAAGAVSEKFDRIATSFRNWTLFIVTVAGIIFGIVKGLTG